MPRKWKSKDILLLLLYAPVGAASKRSITGRTRLQKLVFLFEKEFFARFKFGEVIPEELLPVFEPWRFGPFSKQVLSDIEFFKAIGFLTTEKSSTPPELEEVEEYAMWLEADPDDSGGTEYEGEEFTLSEAGEGYVAENLWPHLNQPQREALSALKQRFTEAPLYVILQYVYSKYPESTTRSEITSQVLGVDSDKG